MIDIVAAFRSRGATLSRARCIGGAYSVDVAMGGLVFTAYGSNIVETIRAAARWVDSVILDVAIVDEQNAEHRAV